MANTYDDINGWYNKYLGRTVGDQNSGWAGWADDPNAEANIRNSGEGQAWAARGAQPVQEANKAGVPPAIAPGVPGAAKPAATPAGADAWGNPAGSQQAGIDAFWSASQGGRTTFTPQELQGWGVTQLSADKYRLPNGQTVDIIGDVGGANKVGQWTISGGKPGENGQPTDGGGGGGYGTGSNGANGANGSDGSGSASASSSMSMSTTPGYGSNEQRDALYAELMARSKQGLNVSATDPNIMGQVDPYRAEQDRAQRGFMADLAEKQGANYGASNLEGQSRVSHDLAGRNTGNFQAQLMGREMESRRTEIQNALAQRGSMLSQDQQLALQKELSLLDNKLKEAQLAQQGSQFNANLGLDQQKLQSTNDQFMAEMTSRNGQWEDTLDLRNRGL